MRFEKLANARRFVSRKVVHNDVDLSLRWLMDNDIVQKPNKLLAGMTRGCFAKNFARRGVERRVKRESPMTVVLKSMPFCTSRRQRKHGIETIQRLNRCLFVYTEDCRVPWRTHIEPN